MNLAWTVAAAVAGYTVGRMETVRCPSCGAEMVLVTSESQIAGAPPGARARVHQAIEQGATLWMHRMGQHVAMYLSREAGPERLFGWRQPDIVSGPGPVIGARGGVECL